MNTSVQLDHKPQRQATEINNSIPDGVLAAKLVPKHLTAAQQLPGKFFKCIDMSHLAGIFGQSLGFFHNLKLAASP
jgi:hypothetical protein